MATNNPSFLAGETLSAAKLQQLGKFGATWVPTLKGTTTNPTLGTGATQLSHVWVNGNHVTLWFQITFGTSGVAAGSGNYSIPLPATLPAMAGHLDVTLGSMRLTDSSTSTVKLALPTLNLVAQEFTWRVTDTNTLSTSASPWTWAASDVIAGQVSYLID